MEAEDRAAKLALGDQLFAAVVEEFDQLAAMCDHMDNVAAAATLGISLRDSRRGRDELCAVLATLAIKLRRGER